MHRPNDNTPRQRGFTLVEIMVVVVIIGLLATMVVPAVMGRRADADISKTKADLSAIYAAAQTYSLKNNRVPTIEDLLTPDANNHPYLEGSEPKDPWSNPYVIRQLDGRLRFEIVSWGPDAAEDTEDDMVYPERKES